MRWTFGELKKDQIGVCVQVKVNGHDYYSDFSILGTEMDTGLLDKKIKRVVELVKAKAKENRVQVGIYKPMVYGGADVKWNSKEANVG